MEPLHAFRHSRSKLALLAVPWALLFGCPAGEDVPDIPPTENSPMSHCADFAQALAVDEGAAARGVRVGTESSALTHISNLAQPSGSRFLASYRCQFALEREGSDREQVSVGLYLVETRAFAEHTQWEDLQIVPIMRVTDSESGTTGYGVFKYLEKQ